MKISTPNNLIAIMVLVLGAPLSAYATSTATVDITVTVTEKFSISVDKTAVTFNDGEKREVKITTTSNATAHTSAATLTITSDVDATGKTMKLKNLTSAETYPVDVKVGGADANFNAATKKTTHKVAAPASGKTQETILQLSSASAAQTLPAGDYKGTLTIVVSPA